MYFRSLLAVEVGKAVFAFLPFSIACFVPVRSVCGCFRAKRQSCSTGDRADVIQCRCAVLLVQPVQPAEGFHLCLGAVFQSAGITATVPPL